jgi:hypothetical protein
VRLVSGKIQPAQAAMAATHGTRRRENGFITP